MRRVIPPPVWLALCLSAFAIGPVFGAETNLNPVVISWLAAQTNIHTWSAEVLQTRALKSLAQPLTATGHVWFTAPNRFRWELGNPAQTIAVRAPQELLIIYPRLKRVERFPLSGEQTGPWRDALGLLETGFPRSESELLARYNVVEQRTAADSAQLVLQPKSAAARRMMPEIRIEFATADFSLKATELQFADGSRMRNEFRNPIMNPPLAETLFAPEIPPDYKIIELGKGSAKR